jgi:hypothetical protein
MFPFLVVSVQSVAALVNAGLAVFAGHLAEVDSGPPVVLLSTAASIGISAIHHTLCTLTVS